MMNSQISAECLGNFRITPIKLCSLLLFYGCCFFLKFTFYMVELDKFLLLYHLLLLHSNKTTFIFSDSFCYLVLNKSIFFKRNSSYFFLIRYKVYLLTADLGLLGTYFYLYYIVASLIYFHCATTAFFS